MLNKNLCKKYGKRHIPPKGEKCKQVKVVLTNSGNDINIMPDSGVPAGGTSTSNDS